MEVITSLIATIGIPVEVVIAAAQWVFGTVVHAFTGTVLTTTDTAACILEGEFQKAGHHVVDIVANGIKDKITTASGIIPGAIANEFGTTAIGVADAKVDQIVDGILSTNGNCPE